MKVREFEQHMVDCLSTYASTSDIMAVSKFRDAGYTDKPYGLKVEFEDGSVVWVQFVRSSPPGGEPVGKPDYYGMK